MDLTGFAHIYEHCHTLETSRPSEQAKDEALKFPNGYVYVISDEYEGKEDVPSEAILGAWKVDKQGQIVGAFIPNPNYKEKMN